ncbi:MAG: hypothetical protein ACLPOK_06665, partial [Methanoregula sp.]|uniref:hypothetical protein n=1 Tax=Methanoregula sp. TaxID=2052170 RepID=UPI003FD72EF0
GDVSVIVTENGNVPEVGVIVKLATTGSGASVFVTVIGTVVETKDGVGVGIVVVAESAPPI